MDKRNEMNALPQISLSPLSVKFHRF
jgi:hypothetical protein